MSEHIIPWWMGYLLISPIRKLRQDPYKILNNLNLNGKIVLDIGSGMGYFSIPLAKLVGSNGKVVCVDLQQKMLNGLVKRAKRRHLDEVIEINKCTSESLSITKYTDYFDFALAFAIVHETPKQSRETFFNDVFCSIKKDGKLLFAEPKGHETLESFNNSCFLAEKMGFKKLKELEIYNSYAVLFKK